MLESQSTGDLNAPVSQVGGFHGFLDEESVSVFETIISESQRSKVTECSGKAPFHIVLGDGEESQSTTIPPSEWIAVGDSSSEGPEDNDDVGDAGSDVDCNNDSDDQPNEFQHHRGRVTFVGLGEDDRLLHESAIDERRSGADQPAGLHLDPYRLYDDDDAGDDDDDAEKTLQQWSSARASVEVGKAALDPRFVVAAPETTVPPTDEEDFERETSGRRMPSAVLTDLRKSRAQLSLMSCNDVHRTFRLHFDKMRDVQLLFNLDLSAPREGETHSSHERRCRLVNTSNWGGNTDDDVLLPLKLVVSAGNDESVTLRNHQREGIRFMWRSLMEGPLLRVPAVGCILAHSMGLGKTGQVVILVNLMFQYFARMRQRRRGRSPIGDGEETPLSAAEMSSCPPVTAAPRVVVVAPKSVLSSWEVEFVKWGAFFAEGDQSPPAVVPCVIDERMPKSMRLDSFTKVTEQGGVVLIGYEALVWLEKDFVQRRCAAPASAPAPTVGYEPFQLGTIFDLVVCDEGHRLKSSKLDMAKALSHLYALRRLVLTGTPMQNHLLEYWAMSDFAVPKFFDRRTFLKFFVQPIQHGADASASETAVALAKKKTFILVQEFANFTQRVDNEPLRAELPPLTEYVVSVPLSALQFELYMKFVDIVRKEHGTRFNVLQAFSYASKICAHPQLLVDSSNAAGLHPGPYAVLAGALRGRTNEVQEGDGLKLSMAVQMVKAAAAMGEKTLVFSMSTKLLDLLESMLNIADRNERLGRDDETGGRVKRPRSDEEQEAHRQQPAAIIKHLRIDGSSSGPDRERRIAEFQNPNSTHNCFLLSTKAAGVGITVTAATRVILLDCSFNPADDRQAIGRAYRYGQQRPVVVYRLVCRNTIEHRIFDQKVGKEWMFETVVNDKNIKRDGLCGTKLRHFFLMKESVPIRVGQGENDHSGVLAVRAQLPLKVQLATNDILAEDVCLSAVANYICSVMRYDSYLEMDHGEQYGAEEAKSYASYRQSGGFQQADHEPPELRTRLDREAATQWRDVTAQSLTLSNIIQNLIRERSASSDTTRAILRKLGVVHDDRYNTHLAPNGHRWTTDADRVASEAITNRFRDPARRPVAPMILLDTEDDDDDDDDVVVLPSSSTSAPRRPSGTGHPAAPLRPVVDPSVYARHVVGGTATMVPQQAGATKQDAVEID